jgi:hypothetical protein
MRVNQNSSRKLDLYPEIDPTPLSSNSAKTVQLLHSYRPSELGQEPQRKHETMPVRIRAKSTTKLGLKNRLCPLRHFTEYLMCAFEKSPRESDLNHESSSLLIR